MLYSLAKLSALIPSSALSAKAVEKIKTGQFIEFKELLADNIALLQHLQEMGPTNMVYKLKLKAKEYKGTTVLGILFSILHGSKSGPQITKKPGIWLHMPR